MGEQALTVSLPTSTGPVELTLTPSGGSVPGASYWNVELAGGFLLGLGQSPNGWLAELYHPRYDFGGNVATTADAIRAFGGSPLDGLLSRLGPALEALHLLPDPVAAPEVAPASTGLSVPLLWNRCWQWVSRSGASHLMPVRSPGEYHLLGSDARAAAAQQQSLLGDLARAMHGQVPEAPALQSNDPSEVEVHTARNLAHLAQMNFEDCWSELATLRGEHVKLERLAKANGWTSGSLLDFLASRLESPGDAHGDV